MKISISGKRLVLVLSLLVNTMFLLSQELIIKEGEVSDQPKCWLLTVTPSNQNVTSPAGTTGFEVASNICWTTSSNQSWCTVTPSGTGNGTIIATYQEFTGTGSRIATITVSGPEVSDQVVTVTQSGVTPSLSVSPLNQNVASTAGTTSFEVTSNISWIVSSNQSWCTVTPFGSGNGTIIASYQEFTEDGSRVATITVSGSGVSDHTVTVTQTNTSPILTVSPANQNVTSPAGTTEFNVVSNISWTASGNQPWIAVTPSGAGNGTIIVTYQEFTGTGTRIATITVSGPGVSDQVVTLTQSGVAPFLTVTPSNQNVESLSGTTLFDVTSNIIWTASSSHSWCTVTTSGEGNGTITASFQDYNEVGSRTAVITVSGPGVTDQTVTVTQAGIPPVLSVTPSNQYVTSSSGTVSFDVISNISWTAVSDQAWCTVTPSGNGNGTIAVTYQNNADAVSRVAVITVTGSGVDAVEVTVTQDELITISYSGSPWCPSAGPQYVSLSGPAGGVFSAEPEGITIDPATGTITTGTSMAGSYVIKYIFEKTEGNRILEASAAAGIIPTVAPEIVIKWQDVLVCSNVDDLYTGYQWHLGTAPIAGANGQYYVTNKVPGIYAVEATDKNGCKIFSNTITVEGTKSILAYPNPVRSSFRLSIKDVPTGKTYIRIINEFGREVMDLTTEKTGFEFSEEIPVTNLSKGFYLVQVTVSDSYSYNVKILVIN